jgi:hypothetical protein
MFDASSEEARIWEGRTTKLLLKAKGDRLRRKHFLEHPWSHRLANERSNGVAKSIAEQGNRGREEQDDI